MISVHPVDGVPDTAPERLLPLEPLRRCRRQPYVQERPHVFDGVQVWGVRWERVAWDPRLQVRRLRRCAVQRSFAVVKDTRAPTRPSAIILANERRVRLTTDFSSLPKEGHKEASLRKDPSLSMRKESSLPAHDESSRAGVGGGGRNKILYSAWTSPPCPLPLHGGIGGAEKGLPAFFNPQIIPLESFHKCW